jgi:hypothetical protein
MIISSSSRRKGVKSRGRHDRTGRRLGGSSKLQYRTGQYCNQGKVQKGSCSECSYCPRRDMYSSATNANLELIRALHRYILPYQSLPLCYHPVVPVHSGFPQWGDTATRKKARRQLESGVRLRCMTVVHMYVCTGLPSRFASIVRQSDGKCPIPNFEGIFVPEYSPPLRSRI